MSGHVPKAAIYCRVSTESQSESGTSLETQELACLRKAAELGAAVYSTFKDEGISGAFYATRPGLQAALAAIDAREANLLIVSSVSRLSRDVEHQQAIRKRLGRVGARLVICDMPVEDTPEGELMYGVGGSFAQYERRLILARTLLGHRRRAEQGLQPYRQRPAYGYLVPQASYSEKEIDPESGKVIRRRYPTGASAEEIGRYAINEAEAEYVREIFGRFAAGQSLRKIASWLDDSGVPTPKGGRKWHPQTICVILRNPTYKGTAAVGRTESKRDEKRVTEGKKDRSGRLRLMKSTRYRESKSEESWITITCPPLVDADTWDRCQDRLGENQATLAGNPRRRFLLSGLVKCPACQRRAAGEMNRGKYPLYSCRRHEGGTFSVSAAAVENAVLTIVEEGLACPDSIAAAFEAFRRQHEQARSTVDLDALRREVADLDERQMATARAQVDAARAGRTTEVYDRLLAEIDKERQPLQTRLNDAERTVADTRTLTESVPTVTAVLNAMRKVLTYPEVTTAERNEAIAGFVQDVLPGDNEVTVHFRPFVLGGASVQSATKMLTVTMKVSTGEVHWQIDGKAGSRAA